MRNTKKRKGKDSKTRKRVKTEKIVKTKCVYPSIQSKSQSSS
jgi:hypothetical protein